MSRPDWDAYFLDICRTVAARADCSRRQVGCVIASSNRVVATGYNGAPAGEKGCLTDGACPRGQSDVPPGSSYDTGPGACIGLHAEQNALLYSARDDIAGGTLYCTDDPCDGCWKMIRGSGIARVVTPVSIRTRHTFTAYHTGGVPTTHYNWDTWYR